MVTIKFAPKDAPDIGSDRWTWPLQSLNDEKLIEKVATWGIELQESLDKLDQGDSNQHETNPQLLWDSFKSDA